MTTSPITNNVILLGGKINLRTGDGQSENRLESWLQQWGLSTLQFAILDRVSSGLCIQPTTDLAAIDDDNLLRLNIFGESGDLLLRRDEELVLWRYVGLAIPDTAVHDGEAYPSTLHFDADENQSALLWGEYTPARESWYEGRVGKAKLDYPVAATKAGQRVLSRAHVVRDSDNQIVAYWTYNLEIHGS